MCSQDSETKQVRPGHENISSSELFHLYRRHTNDKRLKENKKNISQTISLRQNDAGSEQQHVKATFCEISADTVYSDFHCIRAHAHTAEIA